MKRPRPTASTRRTRSLQTPLKELTNKEPTENSRGLRFGNMVQLRDVWSEEIEAALAGKKTAKQALDTAVARGNAMLRTVRKDGKQYQADADRARPRAQFAAGRAMT